MKIPKKGYGYDELSYKKAMLLFEQLYRYVDNSLNKYGNYAFGEAVSFLGSYIDFSENNAVDSTEFKEKYLHSHRK